MKLNHTLEVIKASKLNHTLEAVEDMKLSHTLKHMPHWVNRLQESADDLLDLVRAYRFDHATI
jgi:hypothetical protein